MSALEAMGLLRNWAEPIRFKALGVGGAAATGVYGLSGSGLLSAVDESIGAGGPGTFTQSGGTNLISGALILRYSGVIRPHTI